MTRFTAPRLLLAAVSAAALTVPALARQTVEAGTPPAVPAEPAPDAPELGSYGFDTSGMDRSVAPGEDFYAYANGAWAKRTEIPADKSNYGMFGALDDLSRTRVRAIIEEQAQAPGSRIGIAYNGYLDQAAIEAKGMAPIQPWLARIKAVKDMAGYTGLMRDALRNGVEMPFVFYVGQDDKDPETYILNAYQAGTGLPDRDYYLLDTEKFAGIRTAYADYLAGMFERAGEPNGRARAEAILALETEIARNHWTREDSSDASKTYNKMDVAAFDALTPGMAMAPVLRAVSPKATSLVVAQPTAFTGMAKALSAAPIAVLKDQLLIRSLEAYAGVLPDAIDAHRFAFYGTTLSGTPEREPRWKRAVAFAEDALGDDIGKLYAAKHFPPAYKAEMDKLVQNVVAAMGRRIEAVDWMQPATKTRAKAKLAAFTTKIGYPDRWHDYADLKLVPGDALGNAMRANHWDFDDNVSKLGTPIRRWEWGMSPQTVNAYANFSMNEIVFPAAILQPPFFDPAADPAINYGGIGAVIGHEISHHFDDQGAKYDETGKLADWWTPEDVKAFEAAGKALVAQYDGYEVFPGETVKGEFTLGENIGDLAGLTVAYDAYRASLNGQEAPVIDGTTGDQRFFLGWAQVWRRNYREAELRRRLLTDPHAPSQQRVAVVRNLDKWYDAFQPKPDDALYLPKDRRVKIW